MIFRGVNYGSLVYKPGGWWMGEASGLCAAGVLTGGSRYPIFYFLFYMIVLAIVFGVNISRIRIL